MLSARASVSTALLALATAGLPGLAQAEVGRLLFVNGVVKIVNKAGVERAAQKGGAVDQGDTVISAPGASAQIEMIDKGFIAVRPSTRLRFDAYVYHERENGAERALISLLKGGFRTITGLIGKLHKENYRIQTPNATIGIRGTDHEPMYISPGETKLGEPGTYDKVNVGIAYIQTPQGTVDISANQVGFVAPGQIPRILPSIPQFYISLAAPPPRWKQERRVGERAESRQGAARQPGDASPDLGKEKSHEAQVNARPDASGHDGSSLSPGAVKTLDSSVLNQGKGRAFDDSGKGPSLSLPDSGKAPGFSMPDTGKSPSPSFDDSGKGPSLGISGSVPGPGPAMPSSGPGPGPAGISPSSGPGPGMSADPGKGPSLGVPGPMPGPGNLGPSPGPSALPDPGKGPGIGILSPVPGPGPSLPNPLQGSGHGLDDAMRGLSVPGKLK